MLSDKTKFGFLGEKTAAKYLENKEYVILETNWKNVFGRMVGEIDIIAKDKTKNELVFVEVKTREMGKYQDTLPEENITWKKLIRLQKTADIYLRKHNLMSAAFRFDAISIWLDRPGKKAKIKHIESL